MGVSLTQLIPIRELTPGAVGAIRNSVIKSVVERAAREMNMPESKLVVRDIRPWADLQMCAQTVGTAKTVETWTYAVTSAAVGYESILSGSAGTAANSADQRYMALFGIRDLRAGMGTHVTATVSYPEYTSSAIFPPICSLLRISVGGANKVIWDTRSLAGYKDALVAFAPSAVVIPQNTSYQIEIYKNRATGGNVNIQLIGVVVEPRGKLVAP